MILANEIQDSENILNLIDKKIDNKERRIIQLDSYQDATTIFSKKN